MTRYKMITDRYRTEWRNDVGLNRLTAAVDGPLAAVDRLESKRNDLAKAKRLTPFGQAEELRDFAKGDTVPVIRKAQNTVKAMWADLEGSKSKLRVPKPDKTDVSSAILRMDMRNWLKTLNRGELMGVLLDKDAPAELLQAAYEVPPVMIGANAEIMEDIQGRLLELHHGPIMRQIDEIDEALTVAKSVITVALQDVKAFLMFEARQEQEFQSWYDHNSFAIDQEFEREETKKRASNEAITRSIALITPRGPTIDEQRSAALVCGAYYIENGKIAYNDPALNQAA